MNEDNITQLEKENKRLKALTIHDFEGHVVTQGAFNAMLAQNRQMLAKSGRVTALEDTIQRAEKLLKAALEKNGDTFVGYASINGLAEQAAKRLFNMANSKKSPTSPWDSLLSDLQRAHSLSTSSERTEAYENAIKLVHHWKPKEEP